MILTGTVHVLKCFLFFVFFYIRSYISNIIYMYFLYIVLSKSASHQLTNKIKIIENIQLTRKLLKGRDGHDGVTGRNGLPGPPGAPG